jgi:exopolysaccharide/PEP-CTERM locus tyrosine autokinase
MDSFSAVLAHYARGLWKRRWLGVAAAAIVCIAGWIGVALIPDRYQVEAKVYVDTDTLLGPLLKGLTVQSNADQQVATMLKTLLTRPNLEQVVRLAPGQFPANTPQEMETAVNILKNAVSIQPLGVKNLYAIGYEHRDPDYAQAVVQALLDTFIEGSTGDKRRDLDKAQQFIDTQIAQYEKQLRDAEQRRAAFKQAHVATLPEQGSIAGTTAAAKATLEQARRDLETAGLHRDSLARQLQQTPEVVSVESPQTTVFVGEGRDAANPERASLQRRIDEAQKQIDQLRLRYTASHPDVVTATAMLKQLQDQLKAVPATPKSETQSVHATVPNTLYNDLKLKLVDEDANIAALHNRVDEAEKAVAAAVDASRNSAEIEAQYSNLNRDYDILNKNYHELLERRESAKLSQAADDRRDTLEFRVVEPPKRSIRPTFPNRPLFYTAVLLAGMAAGAGIAGLLTHLDSSFSTAAGFGRAVAAAGRPPPHAPARRRLRRRAGCAAAVLWRCRGADEPSPDPVAWPMIPGPDHLDRPHRLDLIERAMARLPAVASPVEPPTPPPPPASPAVPAPAAGPEAAPAPAAPKADPPRPVAPQPLVIDLPRLQRRGFVTPAGGRTRMSEEMRVIKRPLLTEARGEQGRYHRNMIMVSSAEPGEGKTFIAINLAMSIAQEHDINVLLVDADLIRPRVSAELDIPQVPGLTEVLTQPEIGLGDVLLRCANISNLAIVPAGAPVANTTELLASKRMSALVADIAGRYGDRIIIVDTPPLLHSTEPAVIAMHMHQAVLVVEAGRTSAQTIAHSLEAISACQSVKLVLNKTQGRAGAYGTY